MNDPCWLPSAIMQTMGALLGIYAVVYVLIAERLGEAALPLFMSKHLKLIDAMFFLIFSLGIATIFTNLLWLDSLSTQIVFKGTSVVEIGALALVLFIGTLGIILLYTLVIIYRFRQGR